MAAWSEAIWKEWLTRWQLDNVRFLPRQPMHAMGGILAGSDALLVHLKDDPLFRITIPSKIQAYLAAGKPILAGSLWRRCCLGETFGIRYDLPTRRSTEHCRRGEELIDAWP